MHSFPCRNTRPLLGACRLHSPAHVRLAISRCRPSQFPRGRPSTIPGIGRKRGQFVISTCVSFTFSQLPPFSLRAPGSVGPLSPQLPPPSPCTCAEHPQSLPLSPTGQSHCSKLTGKLFFSFYYYFTDETVGPSLHQLKCCWEESGRFFFFVVLIFSFFFSLQSSYKLTVSRLKWRRHISKSGSAPGLLEAHSRCPRPRSWNWGQYSYFYFLLLNIIS